MENIIDFLNDIPSKIPEAVKAGAFVFPLFLFSVYLLLLLVCLFSKKIKYADKSFAFYLCLFSLCLSPIADTNGLIGSYYPVMVILPLVLSFVLQLQSKGKGRLTNKEKRLIGKLSAKTEFEDRRPSTVKRVEFIRPLSDEKPQNDGVDPNLSGVKKAINALKRRDLSDKELKEIENVEIDVEKYSVREPSPYERAVFSDEIMKIIKLCSKYCVY
ncbi:MAG: hypothetical protein IJ800_05250 [Clostridia bacterium]|nr:hypothetical protein [Clostridia bacterium]